MTTSAVQNRSLRIGEVVEKTGLSAPTIWRLSATGHFPKPIKLSAGCTVWLEREIDDMLNLKAAERSRQA